MVSDADFNNLAFKNFQRLLNERIILEILGSRARAAALCERFGVRSHRHGRHRADPGRGWDGGRVRRPHVRRTAHG